MPLRRRLRPATSQGDWVLKNPRQCFAYSRNYIFSHVSDGATLTDPVMQGTVAPMGGPYGAGGDFDGSSDAWYTNAAVADSPAAWTMLALVRPDVADSTERSVLSLSNTADDTILSRLSVNASNTWRFQVRANDGSIASLDGATSVVAGTPAVLGGVYRTGAFERSLWVNGRKEASEATAGVGGPITYNRTSIGVLSRSAFSHWFSGQIVEAHIFPFAFSDSEMAAATLTPAGLFTSVYANRVQRVFIAAGGSSAGPLVGDSRLLHGGQLVRGRLAA